MAERFVLDQAFTKAELDPALGRENPAEAILSGKQPWQVDNRWFSVSFAWDVAEMLWQIEFFATLVTGDR